MTRDTNILQELLEISPLVAQIGKQLPYSLPNGYFDTLDRVILARVAAGGNEENSLLNIAGKMPAGTVPEGYFDTLAGSILSKIKAAETDNTADELKNLSPFLANISKENVYHVPAGYFAELPSVVTAKASAKETANVVSIFSRKVWMRYAAAAVVFGIIAFGINFLFTTPAQVDAFVKKGLTDYKTEQQLNDALAQINDDDIYNYLEASSGEKDTETIIEMVDEDQLPSETEYMNEGVLESLMNEIEPPENSNN
jgi:uncharacterized protein YbgA (DUF1722 family)